MRRRRQRGYSNRSSTGGGARCSSRRLHWRVLQENPLVEDHHLAECRQLRHWRNMRSGWAAGEGKQRRWLRQDEGLGLKGGEGVKVSLPVLVTTDNLA